MHAGGHTCGGQVHAGGHTCGDQVTSGACWGHTCGDQVTSGACWGAHMWGSGDIRCMLGAHRCTSVTQNVTTT